jgi:hypothetical protein
VFEPHEISDVECGCDSVVPVVENSIAFLSQMQCGFEFLVDIVEEFDG